MTETYIYDPYRNVTNIDKRMPPIIILKERCNTCGKEIMATKHRYYVYEFGENYWTYNMLNTEKYQQNYHSPGVTCVKCIMKEYPYSYFNGTYWIESKTRRLKTDYTEAELQQIANARFQ